MAFRHGKIYYKTRIRKLVKDKKKKRRTHSLFNSAKEGFLFGSAMIIVMIIPVELLFLNAEKLGFWWLVILLAYSAILASAVYLIYRYRELTEIRGYFTKEEFKEKYPKDARLLEFMDRIRKILLN